MTVKEFYERLNEAYETVVDRFGDGETVRYFCMKFLQDRSFEELTNAMRNHNAEAAFRAVHTLKGVCLNLGFGRLGKAASELTEYLRDRPDTDGCDNLYSEVVAEYRRVADALTDL